MSMTTNSNPSGADAFHKGDRIRKARELAGFRDIKSFADVTGLDRGTLGQYEATGEVPRRGTIKSIALATKVRLDWLETGVGPMYNEGDGPDGGIPSELAEKITNRSIAPIEYSYADAA